jgi:hypothetical protein
MLSKPWFDHDAVTRSLLCIDRKGSYQMVHKVFIWQLSGSKCCACNRTPLANLAKLQWFNNIIKETGESQPRLTLRSDAVRRYRPKSHCSGVPLRLLCSFKVTSDSLLI